MIRQNMGRLDRALRFIAGVALIPIGLFALSGWQGNLIGVLVLAPASILLVTGLTGVCPGYIPLGISTAGRQDEPSQLGEPGTRAECCSASGGQDKTLDAECWGRGAS